MYFDQHAFYKAFGCGKPYEEHDIFEVEVLLIIEEEFANEERRKSRIREAQMKAKGGKRG